MAKTLEEWIDTTVAAYKKKSIGEMSHVQFFRDPPRPQMVDNNFFFSPADGVILYQKTVKDGSSFLEVKGVDYTLKDLMQSSYFEDLPCLVVGVFMTFFDVHINRIPFAGRLNYEYLEPIHSRNLPMLLVEKGLFDGEPERALEHLSYLKANERVMNEIYSGKLDYSYWVVQIADKDVSAIMPFEQEQNEFFSQNERFSLIRWGSQVDIVLPLDDRFKLELCQKEFNHVRAGLDPLVKIIKKELLELVVLMFLLVVSLFLLLLPV